MTFIIVVAGVLCIVSAIMAICMFGSHENQLGATFVVSALLLGLLASTLGEYRATLTNYQTAYENSQKKVEQLQADYNDSRVDVERLVGKLKVADLRLQVVADDAMACDNKLENISELLEK